MLLGIPKLKIKMLTEKVVPKYWALLPRFRRKQSRKNQTSKSNRIVDHEKLDFEDAVSRVTSECRVQSDL